ncbi:helix-turn-helix DNA binding domain protein [Microbacterium phage Phinky]|nr:helix-turn-helix DNA binding domain protein [Microbacterium phage Phinky]
MSTNEADPLLTPGQTAEQMSISLGALKSMRYRREGPTPVRIGYRTIRYRQSAVTEFIAAREQRQDG